MKNQNTLLNILCYIGIAINVVAALFDLKSLVTGVFNHPDFFSMLHHLCIVALLYVIIYLSNSNLKLQNTISNLTSQWNASVIELDDAYTLKLENLSKQLEEAHAALEYIESTRTNIAKGDYNTNENTESKEETSDNNETTLVAEENNEAAVTTETKQTYVSEKKTKSSRAKKSNKEVQDTNNDKKTDKPKRKRNNYRSKKRREESDSYVAPKVKSEERVETLQGEQ